MDNNISVTNRRVQRTLVVKSVYNITPNMRRVMLHGSELASFPQGAQGAYIKLLFNSTTGDKPVMRTYTVVKQRYQENEIDVDFVLHTGSDSAAHGVACFWASGAKPGDEILISGPGPAKFINTEAESFILGADMTALPALLENLQRLPATAQGQVFIEIQSEADKQSLTKPEKIAINWVINADSGSSATPLFHAISQTALPAGKLSAWIACEFTTMQKIRHYLKSDCNIDKTHLYISSYWKKGVTEEQHKIIRQADAKQINAQ